MIPVFENIYHSWKIISTNTYAIGFLIYISVFIISIVLVLIIVILRRCSQKNNLLSRFRCCGWYPDERIPLTMTWEEAYEKENELLKSENNDLEGCPSKNKGHTVIDVSDKGERKFVS